jgi:hypothetical protein
LDRDTTTTTGAAVAGLFTGTKLKLRDIDGGEVAPRRVTKPVALPLLPPPPKKEIPYTMEIISGNKKAETKFDASTEGK